MNFELSDEQTAIAQMAADFASEQIAPFASDWDRDHTFPEETLRQAAALGFAAMTVSEAEGGAGLSRLDAAIVFEELARACPSTAAYLSIHNMVAGMIDRFGEPAQKAAHLPSLVRMERFGAYCLTEPNSGSDAASLRTRARLDGDDYVIDGAKAFISGGGRADIYLVMCRTGGEGAGGISAILVEAGTPGLSFGAQEEKMGWHSQPTAAVMFDSVRVPRANR
ncbi:MAG: acyl-CoA dehydrogenase family protein, partial [Pseudomonadota bacterium]